jgi:multidrug efflux pump subunit AcrA (membrane-fusion protein)
MPRATTASGLGAQPRGAPGLHLPAITLVDTSQLYIELRVDEVDVAQLSEDQAVRLTLDALPGVNVTGKIEFIALIASQAAAVTNYPVKIVIDPTPAPIRVGMSASATIIVDEVTGVVRVPNTFVRIDRRANQAYVNLVNPDGTLAEVPVNLGIRTDEYSEVLTGLVEGDVIGISLDSNFSLF